MNDLLEKFKSWFEQRNTRERVLTMLFAWTMIYVFFKFTLLGYVDTQKNDIQVAINKKQESIKTLHLQLDALAQLAHSTQYKEWQNNHDAIQRLNEEYHFLLQASPAKEWQDVIKALLHSQTMMTLEQIKNLPETTYNPTKEKQTSLKVFQQQLLMRIHSDYFGTVNYLTQLEKLLPYLRWNTLNYEVAEYPNATIQMEFSILYAKNQ